MTDLAHILLVDDDPILLEIERHQLGQEGYRYSTASDGIDALAKVVADKPAVILLDVVMPGLDGLETCRRIRADEENGDIHIIFVTSQDDAETRLAAYEAGGDDVLVKPLNPAEIRRKVEAALESRRLVTGLRKEVADTMGVLMSTLVTSGEYGVILNALRQSLNCRSLGDLAEVMLKALEDFGLAGSVQLRTQENVLTLNSEHRSSPLEQEMLLKLSLENRHIYDYGNRTAFCYPNVAILIKAMPLDDPETYGRIKDNIALLAEAGEFRLNALQEEILVRRQRETLATSATLASQVLASADAQYKRGQSEMSEIFSELEAGLEWSIAGFALTEDQEQGLWGVVRPLTARATALYDEGLKLDAQLKGALDSLRLSLQEAGALGGEEELF